MKKRKEKIVALLTGRGGSKLRDKNILKINGIPCMQYPCREAKKLKLIDNFFVSSEDKNILKLGSKLGFEKIVRPRNLSQSNTLHIDVLNHSIKILKEKYNIIPDILIVLLANAPIIKSVWIKKCVEILRKNKEITAAVPVVQNNDHHPIRSKKIKKGLLREFIKHNSKISSNRQDLEKNYFLCHNFWVIRTKSILKNNGYPPWNFMGKKVKPYVIDNSIDIHSIEDIILAKYLLKKMLK